MNEQCAVDIGEVDDEDHEDHAHDQEPNVLRSLVQSQVARFEDLQTVVDESDECRQTDREHDDGAAAVNSLPPTMSASSEPNPAEPTMARPPIVGVPALVM